MAIYSFWIFDRHCNCIYNREWSHYGNGLGVDSGNNNNNTNNNSNSSSNNNITTTNANVSSRGSIGSGVSLPSTTPVNSKAMEIASSGFVNTKNNDHEAQLLFGTLFSMRKIIMSLSSTANNVRNEDLTDFNRGSLNKFNELKSFSTMKYKCHFYETLNGLKFVLLSDPSIENLQFVLVEIYTKYYMNYVVRNPLVQVEFKQSEVISNPVFIEHVDSYISSLPSFIS